MDENDCVMNKKTTDEIRNAKKIMQICHVLVTV